MPFKEAQDEVHKAYSKFNPPYWPIKNQYMRLVEEVGEVGRELNHIDGVKKKKADDKNSLADELADVIFTVICMANNQEIDLDEAFKKMIDDKIYGRDKNRYGSSGKEGTP